MDCPYDFPVDVSAEDCVTCPYWDSCENVMATVIPDLLELLARAVVTTSQTYEQALIKRELHDIAMSVIARLKGEHFVSANDEMSL